LTSWNVASAQTGSAASPAGATTIAAASDEALDEVQVNTTRYKSPYPSIGLLFRPGLDRLSNPSYTGMGAYVVTATRTPEPPDRVAATLKVIDGNTISSGPALTLDGLLRSVPGFSLFRRSDSLTANPTAQGVSLRGLGPSGASRSLVLLDGVPMNDPFGGWVTWTKLPREALGRVEMVPGGGATVWGNAALGGVVQLFTREARTQLAIIDSPASPGGVLTGSTGTARFNATFGDYGTRSLEFVATAPAGDGVLQLLGRDFSTDGFSLVAPERRGPIDIAAWTRHRSLTARFRHPLGQKMEFTVTARGYEEYRDNGTPYQRNGSREKFVSVAVAGQPSDDFAWNAVVYGQDQSFASTFSSVNATRTAETPASDQYAVPATAAGGAWTGIWKNANTARTSLGVDARFVRGETRENFTFTNGVYTRQRVAGGEQEFAGLFLLHERPLTPTLRATVGGRLDFWDESDGHRRESDRFTGVVSRDDHYADLDGTEFSPSAGLVWQPAKQWRLRASAQQSFRRPTLNELYRPFRQGANVTETNPDLKNERNTSGELGVEWKHGPFALNAATFWNELHDAVGNVTVARGPGTFPLFGTLAAGGVGRQRLNLDRTRVRGVELSGTWTANKVLSFNASYLYDDTSVQRAPVAPALVGKQLAQVPRNSATVGAVWRAPGKIKVTPRVRWIGRQFEDDENTLILGEAVVADLTVSRPLGQHLEIFVTVENIGNARVETGRSADGVVNVGTPRLALGGLRGSW
jgi:outer membrane receptor protein involved in Fe transport